MPDTITSRTFLIAAKKIAWVGTWTATIVAGFASLHHVALNNGMICIEPRALLLGAMWLTGSVICGFTKDVWEQR